MSEAKMAPPEKLKSKYVGCMLGAAIGDALGKQNEGLGRKDILENGYVTDYGKARAGSPGEKLKEGQYTDDTEQMIALAQSLVECNGFVAVDFAGRIVNWGADAQNDRKKLVGPSSSAAISRLNSGITWKDSGSDIPSCGSAMRVAPIGLFYKDMDEIESNAALSSVPTHNSKGAIAGAVAIAIAVRSALREKDCIKIIKDAAGRASKYDTGLAKKIELSFEKKDIEPDRVFEEFGTSYMVYDTVPCAFYCLSRHFGEPEKAIIEAVNAGGDTDSIACMTGALCGALHGIDAFPENWLKGLENREMLEHLSNMIWRKAENITLMR
jgi:ADP-ribosyl-[dinitrogen reductase] hydrolase